MKRFFVNLFFCILLIGSTASGVFAAEALFDQANQAYRAGQFERAEAMYQQLIQKEPHAAVYHFNYANACFRQKKIGLAILGYERALLEEPRNDDALFNLRYVNSLLEYRIQDKRNWYLRAADALLRTISLTETLFVTLTALFTFLVTWVLALLFRRGMAWGWIRKSLIILVLSLTAISALKFYQMKGYRAAIVLTKNAEVHYGPSADDQIAFRLGEGLKVFVVKKREGWNRILLINGESGWIHEDAISLVDQRAQQL